jgi:hypothetical protein
MSADSDYDKVVEFLKTLGVEVVEVKGHYNDWLSLTQRSNVHVAPFTGDLAVDWAKRKILFYGNKHPWPHLVHEAGHLLASKVTPDNSNEISFLGWEVSVVKHLNLSMEYWVKNNSDYGIDEKLYADIGALARVPQDFEDYMKKHIDYAKKHKMVSEDGVPLVVRKRRSTNAVA